MKIERLRNGRYKLIFLCGFILVVVLLILSIIFKGSKAKYRNTQVIPLINGRVKNNVPSFTTMGIYLEDANGGEVKGSKKYTKQGDNFTLPSEGYVINETNSYCEKYNASQDKSVKVETAKLYTDILGNHSIKGVNKGSKCYIYLDKGTLSYNNIGAKLLLKWGYTNLSAITERTDFSKTVAGRDTANNRDYIYKAEDDYGMSYYLAGNPQNNWVKFAGFFWRIVRINGNDSLRLIYQGTAANATGTGTHLQTSGFNTSRAGWEMVGYMFTIGSLQGLNNSSTVKGVVDNFYSTKLTNYSSYIDKNAGFCNDRTRVIGASNVSYYGTNKRLDNNVNSPILTCPEKTYDLFTVSDATKGNKKLTYPIVLITADEVAMGGLVYGKTPSPRNDNMYETGQIYWTMSPNTGGCGYGWLLYVEASGFLRGSGVTYNEDARWTGPGVRPVINLVKDITFSKGDGTSTNPFEI